VSGYQLNLTDDVTAYLDAVEPFLLQDPVNNGILIRVPRRVRQDGGYDERQLWMWATDGSGDVVLAAQHTPPHHLWLTPAPSDAVVALADELAQIGRGLDGVGGNVAAATVFKDRWAELSSQTVKVRDHLGVLRCLAVTEPPQPAGHPRQALADDEDHVVAWQAEFITELGLFPPVEAWTRAQVREGSYWYWTVDDQPVSLAAVRPTDPNMAHIGPVYTPREHRRNGYAAALTAYITKLFVDAGRIGTLFTDALNPTSNGIYESIGYERIGDAIDYDFVD